MKKKQMCVAFHAYVSGVTHMRQEFTACEIKSHVSIVCRFYLFSLILLILLKPFNVGLIISLLSRNSATSSLWDFSSIRILHQQTAQDSSCLSQCGWEGWWHVGDMSPWQPNVGKFGQNAPVMTTQIDPAQYFCVGDCQHSSPSS